MVEVEVVEVVDVVVAVEGRTTVNAPEGDPDAIFLVAVRIKVEVTVAIAVQKAGDMAFPAVWGDGGRPEDAMRQLHAELTNLLLYGASPTVNEEGIESTCWPAFPFGCCRL
jgi:hypothetical protein